MKIDATALEKEVADRFVTKQKHPDTDLWIYNYSQRAQYERHWNDITMQTRGLILDSQYNVVARPFKKFFNLGEEDVDLPAEDFEITEKMDGSLGILYWIDGDPCLATRGSFTSEQANYGTNMFRQWFWNAGSPSDKFERGKTYLFEIIAPWNRIVVDYKGLKANVMLAVIDNETGKDHPLPDWYPHLVKRYDGITDLDRLKDMAEDNREGFCIRFVNGLRLKVKFDEYVRLHRIVTQINARHIWEMLRDGKPLDEVLERVPDEFYQWVKDTESDLRKKYDAIDKRCIQDFEGRPMGERKEVAMYFQKCQYPSVLFKMLDGQPYTGIIWKQIKPKAEVPFREEV